MMYTHRSGLSPQLGAVVLSGKGKKEMGVHMPSPFLPQP